MINSVIVKISKKDIELDNSAIEKYLVENGYNLVRWAIVGVNKSDLEVSISYSC